MEYFRIREVETTEEEIQQRLSLANLDELSTQIFNLDTPNGEEVAIGGLWGEFTLTRSTIKGGVRFTLLECPNALSWTVTTGYPPAPEALVVHMTINRQEIKPEFNEELEEFIEDHCECLEEFLSIVKLGSM
ncbi:MAG: hypothetical protein HKP14_10860 [Bacteroidia bacterium]|nr:hypothetical protein [Bacteroidia bacterium]